MENDNLPDININGMNKSLIEDTKNIKTQINELINQNGGFWIFGKEEDAEVGSTIGRPFTNAKTSETAFIEAYEKLVSCIKNYYTKYGEHIKNLEILGDRAGFDSLEYIFKHILLKEHIKPFEQVDRANPLLIRNYLVADTSSPKSLMKNHLYQQILYKLRNDFTSNEQTLIKDIQPFIKSKDKIQIVIRTADNKLYSREVEHKRLNLNLSTVKSILRDIIDNTKSTVAFGDDVMYDVERRKQEKRFEPAQLAKEALGGDKAEKGMLAYDFRKTKKVSRKSSVSGRKGSRKTKNSSVRKSLEVPEVISVSGLSFSNTSAKGSGSRKYTTGAKVSGVKDRTRKTANKDLETEIRFSSKDIEKIPEISEKIADFRFTKGSKDLFETPPDLEKMKKELFKLSQHEYEEKVVPKTVKPAPVAPEAPAPAEIRQIGQKEAEGVSRPDIGNIVGRAGEAKATPQPADMGVDIRAGDAGRPKKIFCKEITDKIECEANTDCIYNEDTGKCYFNRGDRPEGQRGGPGDGQRRGPGDGQQRGGPGEGQQRGGPRKAFRRGNLAGRGGLD